MATSTITIISGASSITLDNTVSTLTLGTSGPAGIGVPSGGTTGQLLAKNSATDYDTEWIDNFTTDVRVTVKNDSGSTLAKGTVVYVSGANGTNILVKPAIATSDATSATTIGFLLQELAANATGDVITQGTITGLNTSAGTAGDPVWLSPTVAGGVVYGVANKPQAPNHLYSLGVLTRSNVNNGEIQVFVNNGWELEELHNVKITSPANNQVLAYDSAQSLWVNSSNAALLNTANAFTVGGHTITNTVAATVPLMVIGAASQTADILSIRASAGSALTGFDASGALYVRSPAGVQGSTSAYIATNNATRTGLSIRGAASQSANLQEWQASTGALSALVDAYGSAAFGGNNTLGSSLGVQTAGSASQKGITVRGAASQTANLQEWQNSAGTILSRINSAGTFLTQGGSYIENTGRTFINSSNAAYIPLQIRGTTSQTGNLTEWQDSGGTNLARVDSVGNIYGNQVRTISSLGLIGQENSGAYMTMVKQTATASVPGVSGYAKLYFRDGTTAGTLKLVVRAGAAGAETTILDNIPQ